MSAIDEHSGAAPLAFYDLLTNRWYVVLEDDGHAFHGVFVERRHATTEQRAVQVALGRLEVPA